MKEKVALGIDIGGTKLRIGLVNEKFHLLDVFLTEEHRWFTPHELVDFLAGSVKQFVSHHKDFDIIGSGVGYPGPICFPKRATFSYSNLLSEAWKSVPLAEMIEGKIGMRVAIDNDANLAGLAEMYLGAGKNFSHAVYVTISTGLGGAIFIDRKLYRGFLGNAGEFGHMVVDLNGRYCKCGNRGCLMSLLSGLGIEKLVQEEPLCQSLFSPQEDNSACVKKLVELAICGNTVAREVMQPLLEYFALTFLNVIQILNPEVIVVGGSLGKALVRHFLEPVQEYLARHLPPEIVTCTEIKEAELGDTNGVLGAAILAFEELMLGKGGGS
ncbi:MAG: ROK family protein [Atribacterota bacterium]|nr:ROK family protein [Atribacterota bacterium]